MSTTVSVALVGINGYGKSYLPYFLDASPVEDVKLVGVIDVALERCEELDRLKALGAGAYTSLEAFFAERTADLVVISSPIQWHCQQSCLALAHGANVLCEKPVAATIQEALQMQEAADRAGKFIAIGYQWSYAEAVHRLKADILSGVLGAPRELKTLVCWPRRESYYQRNNWAGALRTASGAWVLDSPVNNATAHYLHNMLYILGDDEGSSVQPTSVVGELYRANPIENFDAAALRCTTAGGAQILFYTAHCVSELIGPIAEYVFENATVRIDASASDAAFTALFADGRSKSYGSPNSEPRAKFIQSVRAVQSGGKVRCDARASAAHTLVMNGLQESQPKPVDVPAEDVEKVGGAGDVLTYVRDLHLTLQEAFEAGRLPSELKSRPWAKAGVPIDLTSYSQYPTTSQD